MRVAAVILGLVLLTGCEAGTASAFGPSFTSTTSPDVEIPAIAFCMVDPYQAAWFGYPVCPK